MRVSQLPGQFVWLDTGTPILYTTDPAAPERIERGIVVRIERVSEPTATRPALAIWSDAEGEHGVEARRAAREPMSLPLSGESPLIRASEKIITGLGRRRRS